jgi:hypothetical protein
VKKNHFCGCYKGNTIFAVFGTRYVHNQTEIEHSVFQISEKHIKLCWPKILCISDKYSLRNMQKWSIISLIQPPLTGKTFKSQTKLFNTHYLDIQTSPESFRTIELTLGENWRSIHSPFVPAKISNSKTLSRSSWKKIFSEFSYKTYWSLNTFQNFQNIYFWLRYRRNWWVKC